MSAHGQVGSIIMISVPMLRKCIVSYQGIQTDLSLTLVRTTTQAVKILPWPMKENGHLGSRQEKEVNGNQEALGD